MERFISGGRAFHPRDIFGGGVSGGRGRTVIGEGGVIESYIRLAGVADRRRARFRRLWPIKLWAGSL